MSRISGAKPEIDEHKADRENPHDVDDGQTGAADSLSNHESSTGGVHGVDGTDSVAGQGDVDDVTTDLNDHAGSSSGVHGVGASNVESVSGSQSKADSAESSAKSHTDTHENKSNPHSSSASDTDLSNHVNDGTNPHGVTTSQIGALASSDYNPESDTHSRPTQTDTTQQGGQLTKIRDGGVVGTVSANSTGTVTVDISSNSFFTDEYQFQHGGASDLTIVGYEVRESDGTVINSDSSLNAGAFEIVTAITPGAVPAELDLTLQNTSNFGMDVKLDLWLAEPYVGLHDHPVL
jgi:hypothetical protein